MKLGEGRERGSGVGGLDLDPASAGAGATWRRRATAELWQHQLSSKVTSEEEEHHWEAGDVSECILLFGAFCNGNMGDVVQPISMENLLAAALPEEHQCFYYSHPVGEDPSRGFSIGEFFGKDKSRVIPLGRDSAWKVNKFKAFVIGGGGIFSDKHAPLYFDMFAGELTVPIVVMGVGASYHAKQYGTLLQKAAFVSARDTPSVERFAGMLSRGAPSPASRSEDVHLVRDPVLSDKTLTDTTGACWRQSQGDQQQLCFVLPAANTQTAIKNHEQFREHVVRPGDRIINVFPKHQAEIEQFEYPETVEEIVDPMEYAERLCSCKAIISTRFHGVILGLHMGVPTFGTLHVAKRNKVAELMIDTMSLPDQFFLIDGNFTREAVDRQVDTVRRLYEDGGRRGAIHDKLSVFYEEFQAEARRMLDAVGIAHRQPEQQAPVPPLQLAFEDSGLQPQAGVPGGSPDGGGSVAAVATGAARGRSTPTMTPPMSGGPLSPAVGGQESLVAVFLLFAIAGLALLPSTAGGRGRGSDQGAAAAEGATANGGHESLLSGDGRASAGRSPVQKEVDVRDGSAASSKPSDLLFALNFVLWIALGVAFSSYSKSYLRDTRDPVGLLALQGVSGSLVLFSLGRLGMGASDASSPGDAAVKSRSMSGLRAPVISASRQEALAAVLHSGQAILTNFSLFVGGVAVTNALKAMEPVAAAVFSYFLLGKRVAPGGVTALVIIVAGIMLLTTAGARGGGHADVGEATDTGGGGDRVITGRVLVSAAFTMAAVSCNALRNVVIKKGDPIPPHRTLFTCSVAAGMIGVTLMVLRLIFRRMDELVMGGEEDRQMEGGEGDPQYGSWMSMDGVNAALCFVGYNFASFNLLARLSPVGHAVGNSVKRVVMFGSGIVLMGEVMSARQLTGAGVALFGVGVYNVAGKRK